MYIYLLDTPKNGILFEQKEKLKDDTKTTSIKHSSTNNIYDYNSILQEIYNKNVIIKN